MTTKYYKNTDKAVWHSNIKYLQIKNGVSTFIEHKGTRPCYYWNQSDADRFVKEGKWVRVYPFKRKKPQMSRFYQRKYGPWFDSSKEKGYIFEVDKSGNQFLIYEDGVREEYPNKYQESCIKRMVKAGDWVKLEKNPYPKEDKIRYFRNASNPWPKTNYVELSKDGTVYVSYNGERHPDEEEFWTKERIENQTSQGLWKEISFEETKNAPKTHIITISKVIEVRAFTREEAIQKAKNENAGFSAS